MERPQANLAFDYEFAPSGELMACHDVTGELASLQKSVSLLDDFLPPNRPPNPYERGLIVMALEQLKHRLDGLPTVTVGDKLWVRGQGWVGVELDEEEEAYDLIDANNYLYGTLAGASVAWAPIDDHSVESDEDVRPVEQPRYIYSAALLLTRVSQIHIEPDRVRLDEFYEGEPVAVPLIYSGLRFLKPLS